MALRMTEEEYAEWQKRRQKGAEQRIYAPQTLDYGAISGAIPASAGQGASQTCCQPPKRQKYGNKRVEIDGLKFDSQHEAAVYQELMLRVRSGELKCVCRQVKFDLGGGYHATKDSRYQYIADFVTIDRNNQVCVLDAKSEATRQNRTYINKKKQMQAEWGLEIQEV